jgi:monoterpene epsilon-lactone hydrolase
MRTSIRALVRPVLAANLPVGLQRFWLEAATALGPAAPGVVRDVGLLGARPAEIHTPAHRADRSILYLHGGAFTLGSPRTHRALCSHLAAATSARVYVLDYRRAPEHPFPAALEDAVAAHADLCARGATPLAIVGDSAGGWLALATALAVDTTGPLGLISPWVDLTVPDGRWDQDTLLSSQWLRRAAGAYGVETATDLTTADLAGLPATTLHVGTTEALVDDARALRGRLVEAGVDTSYQELPGLWHVAQAQAGQIDAATGAIELLAVELWRDTGAVGL